MRARQLPSNNATTQLVVACRQPAQARMSASTAGLETPSTNPAFRGDPVARPALPFGHALDRATPAATDPREAPCSPHMPTARQEQAVRTAPRRPSTRTPSRPASGSKNTSGSTACCAAATTSRRRSASRTSSAPACRWCSRRTAAATRIFEFLGSQLVLRPPLTPRRRESMWRQQYDLLLAVQRSPANRHPHPKFQLDQLTTACVALCRQLEEADGIVLRQARLNMAERSARWRNPPTA
jgi:hypothetical protein